MGKYEDIFDEKRYDEPYVKEQTDIFFVVEKTGRFLRGSDVKHGGKEDVFTSGTPSRISR